MRALVPHPGLAFPYNVAIGQDSWSFHPFDMRLGLVGIIGMSTLLILFVPYGEWLRRSRNARLGDVVSRIQSVLVVGLALLCIGELFVIVYNCLGVIGLVIDSGLAKVQLALVMTAETLAFGMQGSWAGCSATIALFLFYSVRTRQVPSSEPSARPHRIAPHILLAALATVLMMGAHLVFGAALQHLISPLDDSAITCWASHALPCVDRAALLGLKRGYHGALACTLAAAVCFALAETRRPRASVTLPATPRVRRALAGVLLLLAATLTAFTQPLVRESEDAIPTDRTFANLTLSIPPPLPYTRGTGPDAAYSGGSATMRLGRTDASRWILPEANSPNDLYQLLRNERELRHATGRSIDDRARGFDVSIDDRMSSQQLREWLASLAAAHIEQAALVLSDVTKLDRPILGKLAGAKWSAARFEIRSSLEGCVRSHNPVIDLTRPSDENTSSILHRIVDARRRGQTLCLAVGELTRLSPAQTTHQ